MQFSGRCTLAFRLLMLVTCLATASACGTKSGPPDRSMQINKAVLTYLLENHLGVEDDEGAPAMLVIDPASRALRTNKRDWVKHWAWVRGDGPRHNLTPLPGLRHDTCVNYVASNRHTRDHVLPFDAPLPVVLLREDEFSKRSEYRGVAHNRAYETSPAWQWFHVRYPRANAHIRLSYPGLGDDGNQAIVWASVYRGSLSGWGGYCLLERVDQRWKVTKLCITVIS